MPGPVHSRDEIAAKAFEAMEEAVARFRSVIGSPDPEALVEAWRVIYAGSKEEADEAGEGRRPSPTVHRAAMSLVDVFLDEAYRDRPKADASDEQRGLLKCSFCGKWDRDVERLMVGPGVTICNECVELFPE